MQHRSFASTLFRDAALGYDAWSLFVPAAYDISQPCQCDPRWEFHYRGYDLCPSRLANDVPRTPRWDESEHHHPGPPLCLADGAWNVCRRAWVVSISDAIFAPCDLTRLDIVWFIVIEKMTGWELRDVSRMWCYISIFTVIKNHN